MISENNDKQIARLIYHRVLSIMKFTLDLEEQKYLERGRQDDRYRFFKKELMSQTYDNLRALFNELKSLGLIQETEYAEDVKDGYKASPSGGSGFINSMDLDDWLRTEEV
jgi:hypothetical protein